MTLRPALHGAKQRRLHGDSLSHNTCVTPWNQNFITTHSFRSARAGESCVRRTMSLRDRVLGCVCGAGGPVRRVLFGVPDREQLRRDYSRLMKKDLQEASRRWSFDFSEHKPLPGGNFEWAELPAARVPALYRDCKVGTGPRPEEAEKERGAEMAEGSDGEEKAPDKQRHALKRKQTNITDFYQTKRRVVATARKSGQ